MMMVMTMVMTTMVRMTTKVNWWHLHHRKEEQHCYEVIKEFTMVNNIKQHQIATLTGPFPSSPSFALAILPIHHLLHLFLFTQSFILLSA